MKNEINEVHIYCMGYLHFKGFRFYLMTESATWMILNVSNIAIGRSHDLMLIS